MQNNKPYTLWLIIICEVLIIYCKYSELYIGIKMSNMAQNPNQTWLSYRQNYIDKPKNETINSIIPQNDSYIDILIL